MTQAPARAAAVSTNERWCPDDVIPAAALSERASASASARRTITLEGPDGAWHTVGWYPGTGSDALMHCVRDTLCAPRDARLQLRDAQDGCVIALSEALPDGVRLTAAWDTQAREPPPMGVSRDAASSGGGSQDLLAPAGEDGDSLGMPSSPSSRRRGARVKLESVANYGATDQYMYAPIPDDRVRDSDANNRGGVFFARLTKFERLSTHLANERTWLAWLRTIFSMAGLLAKLMEIIPDLSECFGWQGWLWILLGCGFCAMVPLSFALGWMRYRRVKEILDLPADQMTTHFGRVGLRHQARLLGVLVCFLGVGFTSDAFSAAFGLPKAVCNSTI